MYVFNFLYFIIISSSSTSISITFSGSIISCIFFLLNKCLQQPAGKLCESSSSENTLVRDNTSD